MVIIVKAWINLLCSRAVIASARAAFVTSYMNTTVRTGHVKDRND